MSQSCMNWEQTPADWYLLLQFLIQIFNFFVNILMAPSRLPSTCPADGGNFVLESSNSKIARPLHSHPIKVRFVSAHRLFHFWNRTLKYYCADPAVEKALLVKEARGTCESEQKGSSFSRHALARPPRFSHSAKRTWKRMPHRQAGVVCGLISVALFSIQVQLYSVFSK